eukprot:4987562-Alexandrium_andersonii.AAC.1
MDYQTAEKGEIEAERKHLEGEPNPHLGELESAKGLVMAELAHGDKQFVEKAVQVNPITPK